MVFGFGKANYKENRRGLREVGQTLQMRAEMAKAAQKGRAWAEANAPVDTGEYKNSFVIVPATVTIKGENRAGVALRNTAGHATAVERRNRILRRSINAIES